MKKVFPIVVLVAVTLASCTSEKKEEQQVEPATPAKKVPEAPGFSEDSAYKFIERQVAFGPRVPNTEPHKQTADYLAAQLKRFGAEVTVQEGTVTDYENKKLNIFNIIGRLMPEKKNRIMLFAHWDTRHIADRDENEENRDTPIQGANDGASGVGVILEIARAIHNSEQKPDIGIDIVFFDAEDQGQPNMMQVGVKTDTWCLGSQYWARNQPIKNFDPEYGILLDMVGAPEAIFPRDGISMHFAPNVVDKVWGMAARLGYSDYFTGQVIQGQITDDHLYVNQIAKIPSIDIIHYDVTRGDFGKFHHTLDDNMDGISKSTLKVVGKVLMAVIYAEK